MLAHNEDARKARELAAPSLDTPVELRTVFLGILTLLAVLAACYTAAEIVLPMVLAFVLSAVFQPVMCLLLRLRLPRALAALIIVLALVSLFVILGLLLSGPIADWITGLPQTLPRLEQRLKFLSAPIQSLQNALSHIENPTGQQGQQVAVQQSHLPE